MADRTLSNNDGVLSSGATLSVSGRQLAFSNRDGVVKAGQSVSVDAGQLGGDGKLLSLGDMTLKSNTTFSNSGQTIANGNLTLSVNGDVSNTGSLLAGSRLDLNSIRLENTEKGEISAGQTWLNVTDTLLNRGLIDGKYTHLQANTLTNSGTGRIYGDAVGVSAATFNNLEENGVAATLAGRERVDLGVQTLNNRTHSLIYSAGDMHTGGMLDANGAATGKAGVLNNHSATIEAAGYLVLSAGQINNVNDHFTTERVVVSTEKVTEYQLSGSDKRWSAGEPGVYVDNDSSNSLKKLHTPEGARDKFTQYDYTRTVEETRVKESDPGKILSGAGMTIVADKLLNDKSQVVAGGLLDIQAGDVENVSVSGERHVTDSGTSTYYYRIRKKGKDKQGEKTSQYTPPTVIQTITLKPGELTSHGQVQGSQVTLSPLKPQGTDVQTGLTGNVDVTVAGTDRIPLRPVVSAGEPVILLPGQQFEVSAPQGSIRSLAFGEADYIVRVHWRGLRWLTAEGMRFDMMGFLRGLDCGKNGETTVMIGNSGNKKAGAPFPARLIAVSLPPEKALISKTRLLSENRRKGRVVQAETLEAAGHVLLLTSLPEDEYSAEQVADCYRLRWQIELAFKRLKSLLHLDALRAKEPELAKAWIFANLLAAFLIDDIIQPSLDFPPRSAGSEKKN